MVPVTDDVELHVLRWPGDGTPFLLVHGLASNARLWDGVAAGLAARGHEVVAVDQRGHGRSSKPDDGYDFGTITGDLAALIDRLELDRPVLAGQSWGGNVAVELAARRPDLLRGIVCVDGGWISFHHFGDWDEVRDRLAPPKTEGTPLAELEQRFRSMHPDWPESGLQGALACFEVRGDGTVAPWLTLERHLAILRAMWDEDLDEVLPRVGVPALLVPCASGDDAWTQRKRQQVAAAEELVPAFRTQWFTADHDVHAQHPDEVADLLVTTLASGFWR